MEKKYLIPVTTTDGFKFQLQIQHKNPNNNRKVKTWSLDEDNRLISLYQTHPKKWAHIAVHMPDRNQNQCLHRFRRLSRLGLNKKIWSVQEDETIKKMIKKIGKNWKLLSQIIKTKTGQQIRERFINKLDPKIIKQEWSQEEDRKIIQLYAQMGSKWSEISKKIQGRPQNKIKNRFYSYIQKNYDINYYPIRQEENYLKEIEKQTEIKIRNQTSKCNYSKNQIIPSITFIQFPVKHQCEQDQLVSHNKLYLQSLMNIEQWANFQNKSNDNLNEDQNPFNLVDVFNLQNL